MREAGPGGHFFATSHTMSRCRTAFYSPLLSDRSNYGRWVETDSLTATERATKVENVSRKSVMVNPTNCMP